MPLMRRGSSESCIFEFYYYGTFLFHLSVSAETGLCTQLHEKLLPRLSGSDTSRVNLGEAPTVQNAVSIFVK